MEGQTREREAMPEMMLNYTVRQEAGRTNLPAQRGGCVRSKPVPHACKLLATRTTAATNTLYFAVGRGTLA